MNKLAPLICNFTAHDAEGVNRLAVAAFLQYQQEYSDWDAFAARISNMAALAATGEIILAKINGDLAGAVVYVGPGKDKAPFFDKEWPILRMLVVDPVHRGHGIGRILTQECINRAIRDGSRLIALHTNSIMKVALPMYQRMGFKLLRPAPNIHGVSYGIYVLEFTDEN